MGRSIGGAVVGIISYIVIAAIINIALMFILGADGIIDEDRNPSSIFLISSIVLAFGISYMGAAIARAIAKDKMGVYIFGGFVALIVVYSVIAQGSAEMPEADPRTPENIQAFSEAAFDASANSPGWTSIVSILMTLAGVALGGFKKDDFKKTTEVVEPTLPEDPEQSA